MAPPPLPIDPALEPWNPISLSTRADIDQILSPTPGPQQRPNYPRHLSDLNTFSQDGQMLQMEQNDPEPRSMPKYCPYPEPWAPPGLAQPPTTSGHPGSYGPMKPSSALLNRSWRPPRSDVDSNTTEIHPLDSGYWSQSPATRSAFSGELASNQECQSLTRGMNEMDFQPERTAFENCSNASQECHYNLPGQNVDSLFEPLICRDCRCTCKNQSEYKYVIRERC